MYHFNAFLKKVKPSLIILVFFILASWSPSFTFGFLESRERVLTAHEPKLTEASSSNVKHRDKYSKGGGVELKDLSDPSKSGDLPLLSIRYSTLEGRVKTSDLEKQRAQTVSLKADGFLLKDENSLMEGGSNEAIRKRWQWFLSKYPDLQTVEARVNREVVHHLQGWIGGNQIWSMNFVIDYMRELIAANQETKTGGTKFLIKVFDAFIASENNPTHYARLKVALSTLLKGSEPDDYYLPQCMWLIHKMVESIESKFLSHPDTASSVWNPDLPPESFVIRDLYDPVLALETATLESVLEISFIEARRAHYILTSGGKHMTAHELRNASDDALKKTVSGIEKALQKRECGMEHLTSADEMTLLKALYVMKKEMKDLVKIGFINSDVTTSGGSTTYINLKNLCTEGTKMAEAFGELIDVAQQPVDSILGIHPRTTRMKIALRAFTAQRLLQLYEKEPVFRKIRILKNRPSLPEIKDLLKQIADPKLLKLTDSLEKFRNHIEILHNLLLYLAIMGFENDNSSVLLELVKSAKIFAKHNGIYADLDMVLTARFTSRYPTLAHAAEINNPIHRSFRKFNLHFSTLSEKGRNPL